MPVKYTNYTFTNDERFMYNSELCTFKTGFVLIYIADIETYKRTVFGFHKDLTICTISNYN
jgi:hypothetical protein